MMQNLIHADNEDWSDCANAQADLSIRWAHISEGKALSRSDSYVCEKTISRWVTL